MHIVPQETDKLPFLNQQKGENASTEENISRSISRNKYCRPGRGRTHILLITSQMCIKQSHQGWLPDLVMCFGKATIQLKILIVQIFNATRHPRHIEAAAIVMYMYLYSLAFMDHPCTLGATVCHQVPPSPLYTQLNPGHVEYELGVLMIWKLSWPEQDSNAQYPTWVECANH